MAIVVSTIGACAESADAINGSGATFPQQFQAWASSAYNRQSGTLVLYANPGGGSSKGKSDFKSGLNDFGGTDSAVSESQRPDFDWAYVPYVGGAIAVTYRLDELSGATLSLSPSTLAGIFSGEIARWDDPRIAADMRSASPWSNSASRSPVNGVAATMHNVSSTRAEIAVLLAPTSLRRLEGKEVEVRDSTSGTLVRAAITNGEVVLPVSTSRSSRFVVEVDGNQVAVFERTEVALPDRGITVVYRQDGSGTTNNLCKYLTAVTAGEWQINDAFTSCVPGGSQRIASFGSRFQGQNGSANLSNYLSNTNGAIGYAEVSFALDTSRRSRGMSVSHVQNSAGRFVPPTANAASAFLSASTMDDDGFVTFNYDQPANELGYPIVAITYALVRTDANPKNEAVKQYLRWIINEFAPANADALGYVALTGELRDRALAQTANIGS